MEATTSPAVGNGIVDTMYRIWCWTYDLDEDPARPETWSRSLVDELGIAQERCRWVACANHGWHHRQALAGAS